MGKVNIVARGLSVLQKATLDFAYKRRLERLERPPSRCGLSEFDFIPAHIVNYYYGFLGTYPWGSDGIVTGGNTWAGGENEAPFALNGFLPGSTFKVDGQVLVEGGALKP